LGRPSESRCFHTAERLHYRSSGYPSIDAIVAECDFEKIDNDFFAVRPSAGRICADVRRIQGQTIYEG
jgi:hypothetical protein